MNRKLIFWILLLVCLLWGVTQIPLSQSEARLGHLVISEFVADNVTGLTDEDGDHSDWIEIHNPGSQPVNLGGWSLTDDPDQPEKWRFPDITLGSGSFLIIYASGKSRTGEETLNDNLHTNFKLDKSGEFLGLYHILQRQFVDQTSGAYPLQSGDIAYGRAHDQPDFVYLAQPTPGRSNDESQLWIGRVAGVDFSQGRGFYDQPFWLSLSTVTEGAAILYTTDGSEPTETEAKAYTTPILVDKTTVLRAVAIKLNALPAEGKAHTYLFIDDVLTQPADPPGYPSHWGRHDKLSAELGGFVEGMPMAADYDMDPDVVDDPRYQAKLRDALQAIPTLSIMTDVQHFTDLYANTRKKGAAWERLASIEFFDPTGARPDFQINAGLRMQGSWGRKEYIPKHSFRLFFKRQYGPAKLEYPLFPNAPVDRFNTLILRGGVNRSYAGGGPDGGFDLRLTTYVRDQWTRETQIEMIGAGSHGIFVHLYLNGLYWGLYNIVERPDAAFMAAYYGGSRDEWFVQNQGGIIDGTDDRIQALRQQLAAAGGIDALPGDQKYTILAEYIDMDQFIDYTILNWYIGNRDWPRNNWYAGVQNPAGLIRFFVWDAEHVWIDGAEINFGPPIEKNLIKFLLDALSTSPEFRQKFGDRLYKHLFNEGLLSDAQAQARWRRISRQLDPAIIAESARWGDTRFEAPVVYEDWLRATDHVLAQMAGNAAKLIDLTREIGFYPAVDPPVLNRQGGLVTPDFSLTLTTSSEPKENVTIYYTTDGSDPRQALSGAVASQAKIYTEPLPITTTTAIKARVLYDIYGTGTDLIWSALNEVTFSVIESDHQLRLTEIMYNPEGGDDYEFIELKNFGDTTLDLTGMSFGGIDYTFPAGGSVLAPGQVIILVRNSTAFAERYPGVGFDGVYSGQLSNKGETIALWSAEGRLVTSVTYDDEQGWPISPDGRGDSLVLIDPESDPKNPGSWRAGANRHGSPGVDDPVVQYE